MTPDDPVTSTKCGVPSAAVGVPGALDREIANAPASDAAATTMTTTAMPAIRREPGVTIPAVERRRTVAVGRSRIPIPMLLSGSVNDRDWLELTSRRGA